MGYEPKQGHSSEKVIVMVDKGYGKKAGIEVGDILLKVNDKEVVDVFDYRYLIQEKNVKVTVKKGKDDSIVDYQIKKGEFDDLDIYFESGLMDNQKFCKNKCIFCFIDQLPKGMRETLYFKDDDSRLSFLTGNYVTLTNMKEEELDRIIFYHLSPINVSVHTTNLELRTEMLKNKNATKVLDYIKKIVDAGIQLNFQIVLVRDVNDGDELDKTISDLGEFLPQAQSLSIVPVGITKFRDGLYDMKPLDKEYANECIDKVEKWQKIFKEKFDTSFVFISDEFYVLAERNIPEYDSYEDFPQIENGVGMMALLEYDTLDALDNGDYKEKSHYEKTAIITGELSYNLICDLVSKIKGKYSKIDVDVIKVKNNFFGETITVSGLLTGADIIGTIKSTSNQYDKVILPKNCLRDGEIVFLDDLTTNDVEEQIGTRVVAISETDGYSFVDEILL